MSGSNVRSRKCKLRVRDALCCRMASRRGSCQSPLVGGHHPRLLARTGTPASLQLEGGCVPPLHYGGKSFLRPFPPVGGRMPRPKPGRARQAQGVRQPMPPSTLRVRYGPRWLGQGRQATLGESQVSVRRPPRQTRRRRGRPARSPIRRRRGLGRSRLCRAAAPCGARGWPAARATHIVSRGGGATGSKALVQ